MSHLRPGGRSKGRLSLSDLSSFRGPPQIIDELKKRFKTVFDYKDPGISIPPGSRWLGTIFESLRIADIGIPLLSNSYQESGNCVHEGQFMVASQDAGNEKPKVIPIRLYPGDRIPDWIRDIQSLRAWDFPATQALVDAVCGQTPKRAVSL